MKKTLLLLAILALAAPAPAQKRDKKTTEAPSPYTDVDRKMLAIPAEQANTIADVAAYIRANFQSQEERIRAIFTWTTASFEYDYDNMFALNFHEADSEKVKRMMALRKGICQDYSAVFLALCKECGIRAWEITGYTRHEHFTSYLAHAWCGAEVDNHYYLFDPTWGSGYINQVNKFVRKPDFSYYKQEPEMMIRTHMPFDPMWQFLYHTVSAQEFADGNTKVNTAKPVFGYPDTITAYEKLNELEQYEAEARRLEANGFKNALAYNHMAMLKNNITVKRESLVVDTYNSAVNDFNLAVSDLNDFINYRNRQFQPAKPDKDIQAMVDSVTVKLERIGKKLASVKGHEKRIDDMLVNMQKQIDDVTKTNDEQRDFLSKYFPKGKLGRKSMFYKYTWMGIPLN